MDYSSYIQSHKESIYGASSKNYVLQVTVNGKQIPIFELNADILGITSAWHAESIACNMFKRFDSDVVSARAMLKSDIDF